MNYKLLFLIIISPTLFAKNISSNFDNKTFMIMKSNEQRCLFFPGMVYLGDTMIDDQYLNAGVCNDDIQSKLNKNFIYKDNKIIRAANTGNAYSFGEYRNMCLSIDEENGNTVVAKECSSRFKQDFHFFEHPSKVEGQYFLKSDGYCLSVDNSSSYMDYCDKNNTNQIFDIVDIKDPVNITLVNRGWYNMSYSIATRGNDNSWRFWIDTPSWLALDGIRNVVYPPMFFQNDSDFVNVYTDFNQNIMINNIMPGQNYEVQSHGTIFNKSMRYLKRQSSPQVFMYEHSNMKGKKIVISQSQSNLVYFNDMTSSYHIPEGWVVRFYTKPNFKGDFYTRRISSNFDEHINDKIRSVKILSK